MFEHFLSSLIENFSFKILYWGRERIMFLSINRFRTYLKSWRNWWWLDLLLNWHGWNHGINMSKGFDTVASWFAPRTICLFVSQSLLGSRVWPANVCVKNTLKWEFLIKETLFFLFKQEYQLKAFVTLMTLIPRFSLLYRVCFKCLNSSCLSQQRKLDASVILEATQIGLRLFWDWLWRDLERSSAVNYLSKRNPAGFAEASCWDEGEWEACSAQWCAGGP